MVKDNFKDDDFLGEEFDEAPKQNDFAQDNDLDLNDDLNDFDFMGDDFGRTPPMERHSDLLKGLTKFDPFIRTLYNNWLAIVWNEEEKCYKVDNNLNPIMNKNGANWHASFIQTYVRDNNILAHLDREEYYDLLEDVNRTLLLTYAKRYEEFGFNCYADVIRVWNEVEDASLLALSGAGGGKYSDFLGGGIVQYRGQFSEQQGNYPAPNTPYPYPHKKRGVFGRMFDKLVGTGKPSMQPTRGYRQ